MRGSFVVPVLMLAALSGCASDHDPLAPSTAADSVATYRVTFVSTWSAATHPVEFPSSAHFSGLIGATHDDRVRFWREGELASPGIQAMAEMGLKSPLTDEIAAARAAGTAGHELSGDGIRPSPGEVSLEFQISRAQPLVTLVSMIAPSPDWFVGVADLRLLGNDDRWVDSLSVALDGWDAGTDDGTTYAALDAASSPHVPIAPLSGGPFGAAAPPFGRFAFVRLDRRGP